MLSLPSHIKYTRYAPECQSAYLETQSTQEIVAESKMEECPPDTLQANPAGGRE